jgi:aminotransferase
MRERTLTISGLSKTFSVTGWRLGYCIAPPTVSLAMRKLHDFVTVGAPHPLQVAAVAALNLGPEYYQALHQEYQERRDFIVPALQRAGFACRAPAGAYYVMTDVSGILTRLHLEDDVALARYMIHDIGVATVPGSSFYPENAAQGRHELRFVFCKTLEMLHHAAYRLEHL